MLWRRIPRSVVPLLVAFAVVAVSSSAAAGPEDCSMDRTNPEAEYEPGPLFEVPVVVHVLMDSACVQGDVSDEQVEEQIRVLNEDFLALPGTNGEAGVDTQIRFVLASEDPSGAPTSGITRDCDDGWYADTGTYWRALAWDPSRYLNMYVNSAAGAGGYVPFLPAEAGAPLGAAEDRLVLNHLALGTGGPIEWRDLGRTGTHEVGHYLGLMHTYANGCGMGDEPDCYESGDRICDTPPNAASSSGCPVGTTSCGGVVIPVENYMDLTDDDCRAGFTREQAMRMRCTLEHYRTGLADVIGPVDPPGDDTGTDTGGDSETGVDGVTTGGIGSTSSGGVDGVTTMGPVEPPSGSTGAAADSDGSGGSGAMDGATDEGCGCHLPGARATGTPSRAWALLSLMLLGLRRRR